MNAQNQHLIFHYFLYFSEKYTKCTFLKNTQNSVVNSHVLPAYNMAAVLMTLVTSDHLTSLEFINFFG